MHLAALALACGFLAAPVALAAPTKSVLVLYSNNRLLPANTEIDRGLRETIVHSVDSSVEVYAEFLDQPAFSGPAYEVSFARYLRAKYVARPPQALVVAGEQALEFVLRERAELFADVPVVHLAASTTYLRSNPPLPADVVGVPVEFDPWGTIQLALRQHPNARRLVLVTGSSPWDNERESFLRGRIGPLEPRLTVEFLAGLPTGAVAKRLSELGEGDIVYTPGYYRDGAGREFAPSEAAGLIVPASGAPVYSPYSTFIGTGIVGGIMPSFVEMGREAARNVNRLLAGEAPQALRLPAIVPAVAQIDWRQAQKWGIDASDLPDDAIVHFRQPTYWEANRKQAIAIVAVFLIQAALIAALLIERRLRHRTAHALQESEKRMNLAARAARLSIWIWDVARDRIWSTPKVPRHSGVPDETPIQFENVLETVHPGDRDDVDRAVRRALTKDEELDIEYRMLQPEGEVRWIAARGRVEDGNHKRLTGVAMDITERKAAELQAERDRFALTHLARVSMMGQLSAAIAHQLNQPLAAILGNAEAARKMLGRGNPDLAELKEICDDIVTEDNRAAEVIRRLGALYKRGEMKVALLDLNELVRETFELVRAELLTRHVVPVLVLSPSLPVIDGGRVQLQQVLLNLILNAADAMSEVEATARKLVVSTELDGANVRLYVIDRGTGIAPQDIEHVFEAFWSTKAGGVGVGLAICQSIVRAHRGTLTVANNPDGGATFCVTWPAQQPA
ncbi:MAG: ATP-binding protein [Burkholderiales bacterium]